VTELPSVPKSLLLSSGNLVEEFILSYLNSCRQEVKANGKSVALIPASFERRRIAIFQKEEEEQQNLLVQRDLK